jgi:hypothetical protein
VSLAYHSSDKHTIKSMLKVGGMGYQWYMYKSAHHIVFLCIQADRHNNKTYSHGNNVRHFYKYYCDTLKSTYAQITCFLVDTNFAT